MYIHISLEKQANSQNLTFPIEILRCHVDHPGDGYEVVAAGAESTAEIVLLAAADVSGLVNYSNVATMSEVTVVALWAIWEMSRCVDSPSKLVRTVVMFEI
jgi:hypothetical protein